MKQEEGVGGRGNKQQLGVLDAVGMVWGCARAVMGWREKKGPRKEGELPMASKPNACEYVWGHREGRAGGIQQ